LGWWIALALGLTLASQGGTLQAAGAQAVAYETALSAAGPDEVAGLVDVGDGRRLYLDCRGAGGPTVVLEAGYGNNGAIWDAGALPRGVEGPAVLPGVADFTRVCVYDRPGTLIDFEHRGRSDIAPMPRTAEDAVADLHVLLSTADGGHWRGPYILVGHSIGGILVRLYASTYPDEVAGLVLVDASHEDQEARFTALMTPEENVVFQRLQELPPEIAADPEFEQLDFAASFAQLHQATAARPLRPMPLVVLSRGRPVSAELPPDMLAQLPPGFPLAALDSETQALQADLATLLPGARHVVAAESGHYIQFEQPGVVIEAVRDVVEAVRRP
jgi:pimeloyl-ACP methyl ester carboxylesterase